MIVCDNASSDGSVERIRAWVVEHAAQWGPTMLTRDDAVAGEIAQAGRVHIVENGANLGFAAGNNSGVRFAMNNPSCRYVWILNNDTTVDSGTLPAAVARMEADDSIGICGSTLVYYHDRDSIQAFGAGTRAGRDARDTLARSPAGRRCRATQARSRRRCRM